MTSLEIASQIKENSRLISLNTGTVDRLIREVGNGLLQPPQAQQPAAAGEGPNQPDTEYAQAEIGRIVQLITLGERLNISSDNSLEEIKKTNETSKDTIEKLRVIAHTGEQQRDYLQNVATLSFWALPIQIFTVCT